MAGREDPVAFVPDELGFTPRAVTMAVSNEDGAVLAGTEPKAPEGAGGRKLGLALVVGGTLAWVIGALLTVTVFKMKPVMVLATFMELTLESGMTGHAVF